MWEFWIDVGGTFTDCLGRTPDGRIVTGKVLSSGVTKGQVGEVLAPDRFGDERRRFDPAGFWIGYSLTLLDPQGQPLFTSEVAGFDARQGILTTAALLPPEIEPGTPYELTSGEEAPVLAIRRLLGLRKGEPIPPVSVRLGTTRGTNALLTRRGARTGFVTTMGFADILRIANQDRPRLFDLAIRKPEPIFERVVEIDERVDVHGQVLRAPQPERVREQLEELKVAGIQSLAICLLHSFAHPEHEQLIERVAREVGFAEISTSSRLSPLIKIVSRGDTTTVDAYLNPILRQYVHTLRTSLTQTAATDGDRGGSGPLPRVAEAGRIGDGSEAGRFGHGLLRMMTSAGGLVDAARFVGKDSILSGPAGGVIGYSRVAERAGFARSIGFDMGGTSTDVSRYDGRYDLEFETRKAGVRVVAPMLAIETVAAGGGSLCGFDDVKLTVGPDSAGAMPGPACYGRGGPLTITDVNLYLGKIRPEHFPFELDREAVERKLRELAERIGAGAGDSKQPPPGPSLRKGGRESAAAPRVAPDASGLKPVACSLFELAEGFVRVANANMVRPIRNISVARGYDPREYVLVTFGGAGGQHACAIARELGMRHVLSHPWAGLLSAYGIGLADVRRFREQAVLKPHAAETLASLEPLLVQMETEARADVAAEGIPQEQIQPPQRSLDLRYQGVEATINVPCPTDGDYARRYVELHQQLYGYVHENRAIEIVAARVEVVGRTPDPPEDRRPLVPRRPEPREVTETWFEGRPHRTEVFVREQLHPGDEFDGPAIVCEPSSTVVVDPGFTCRVLAGGELLLTDGGSMVPGAQGTGSEEARDQPPPASPFVRGGGGVGVPVAEGATAPADPVLLEIFNNLFASIAEQMGITLQRTSFSTNVKERLDFSCAIFDPGGDLVVNAPHIPVHLGAMSETVKRILADNPQIQPGDVFVTNDPYRGGSHLPDVTVITPVHDARSGELLFLTASRAHHAEIGGIVPGSMPPFSRNLGEEGVLIRNFKLVEGLPVDPSVIQNPKSRIQNQTHESALRDLLLSGPYPTRSVRDNLADVSAQVAANHSGALQLEELVRRYTLPVVQAYMQHIQQAAAKKMRMALERIPDGSYRFTDHLDDGSPIAVEITIRGDSATVDFTGTGPVLSGNLNANRAIVTAATLYVFRCLINEDIPLNSGVLHPVTIVLPECLLNPPEHADPAQCAAMVGGNVETSQRVVDSLLGALGLTAASQGTMNNLTFGDGTFGYYETICGGSGATPAAHGADAVHTHMTNTRLTDPEVIERRYPVRVIEFSIRRGSGGGGKFRGGDGVIRKLQFLKSLRVSILSERRGPYRPFGLAGGQPGEPGRNTLRRAGQTADEDLGGKTQITVEPGDVLTIATPGGGGCGAP